MTVGIIPESDREGRAVCQSWLQGVLFYMNDFTLSDIILSVYIVATILHKIFNTSFMRAMGMPRN